MLAFATMNAADARRGHGVVVCDKRGCTKPPRWVRSEIPRMHASRDPIFEYGEKIIGGRPPGCPHAFCGCEASRFLFGKIRPELNLAANWMEKFPRTSPAPGMAAARRGHVMVLLKHVAGNYWLVHDGNSGHHLTRVHVRSIRGYTVVDPHATMFAKRMRASHTQVAALPRENVPLPRKRAAQPYEMVALASTPKHMQTPSPVQTVAVPLPPRRAATARANAMAVASLPEQAAVVARVHLVDVPLPRKRMGAPSQVAKHAPALHELMADVAPKQTAAHTPQTVGSAPATHMAALPPAQPTVITPKYMAVAVPPQTEAVSLPSERTAEAKEQVATHRARIHHRHRHKPSLFERVVHFVKNL